MNPASLCLQDEQVRCLLEDDLLPQDAADCEAHLANCQRCRDKVEALIGNADWWQEAEDSLRTPQDRTATLPPENQNSIAPHADILRLLGPTDNPQMLGRIGSYEIVGILGRGGMGVVFKGFDPALNRFVAIKMLAPHLAASGAARKRFEREAQAAAAIVHDHVMAIHGVADWQGTPYLVMPYVRGASLQKRIDDQGPFQLREILRIGMQTAAGLAAAHAQGLVHRDIKPANIMLASGVERVALTDFGLARAVDDATLTRTGTLAGTPQYMSPEQARGQAVDFRSDLFSLGSVLYTLCTGRPPFRAETSYGILRLITDDEPRPIQQLNPDIPVWLCTLVGRLMAKNPADRFASADDVSKLLEKCLAHIEQPSLVSLPIELLPPPQAVAPPAPAPTRKLSRHSIAIACGLLLAIVGIYFGFLATNPPEIAGTWQGEDWGTVVLKSEAAGQYAGEFSETVGNVPGQLQLKWSRIERRYNGSWKDGDERLGDLSLRLVDQQIRGAYSTSANSKTNPATPRLADFTWTRTTPPTASNASPPTEINALNEKREDRTKFDILFDHPGIYLLTISARRQANENSDAGPLITELGTQVVEVLAEDVTRPVARIERIKSLDKLPSHASSYRYQLLSGNTTRSLGSQVLKEKEENTFQTSPDLRGTIACEHQSSTKLATFQENGHQVQIKLQVLRWALDDTIAPKKDRIKLSASGYGLLSPKTEDWFRENPFIDFPGIFFTHGDSQEGTILAYPPSQADLQLTPYQLDLINSLLKEVGVRQQKICERETSEYRKVYFCSMELGRIYSPVLKCLNSEQQERLRQLTAQAQGYSTFKYGRCGYAIKPTPSQQLAMDNAIRNFEQKIAELAAKEDARLAGDKGTISEEPSLKLHTVTKQNPGRQHLLDLWQTIHDILSEEQRQKFNEFRGPPLKNVSAALESPQEAIEQSSNSPPAEVSNGNTDSSGSTCDIAFFDPGIYRLSIYARRRANENPEAGPVIRECGSQVVEVKPEDLSQLIAKLSFFTLPSENSKDPGTMGFRLLSGTLVRSLGNQVLRDQASWKVSPDLPEVIHCEHQKVTPLATYQDGSWLVQMELHVQRWAPDDTTAPKEDRMRLGINLKSTPSHAVVQDLHTKREDGKRMLGITVPQDHIANVALIARSKNAARVLRRLHVISQKGTAVGCLQWEVEHSLQAGVGYFMNERYEVGPANKEDGTTPTSLASPESLIIEPRLFNPQTREKAEETKINLVVPFIGGSDLPLEVASGETKEALLFFDVSADQIEHEIWVRVSLDPLPQNLRPQNAFHASFGSSWKVLRYPRPESEVADVELSIPLSNKGYDLPLELGTTYDFIVQMQLLELLAPYTQGAGLDGSHDLVLKTSSDLTPEILAKTTHDFSHHTKMRIRTRPTESKNLRTLAPPSVEKITEAFSKALQGNWKCIETLRTDKEAPAKLKEVDTVQFAGQQLHVIARGQKPEEKTAATFELDADKYPVWITVKSESGVEPGILTFLDGKLLLQFGISPERPESRHSTASVIGLLLEKVPETTIPNSVATSSPPAAKVLADKVVIKSAQTVRNHLLVDIEMNIALTPSWLRSLYLGPDRPVTSADVQNRTHDYPLVSSVSDWPLNGNYQLSSGNQSQRFAFIFPSNEAASLALKQVDDLSRKGPQTLTATTALQLFRVEYDDKTYQGGIDIREGAAASTNLNAPVRLTLFVPYTFTLSDWKKFAAALEGPDVRILITQDAKGKNRPIQAALKIDPKYSSHDLGPITEALKSVGLPSPPKENQSRSKDDEH